MPPATHTSVRVIYLEVVASIFNTSNLYENVKIHDDCVLYKYV